MTLIPHLVSRRRFLAGTGVAAACFGMPALSTAQTASDGFRLLRARPLRTGGEAQSAILSYDGAVPGPTLRVKRVEELRVRLINELAEPTTVHWHGVRLPNAMDGVPQLTQPPVAPGTSFDYRFRPPDAGTFWYHAHIGPQVDRGLHGALIVEEIEPVDVDRDIVLVFAMPAEPGGSSPLVLVNGSVRPDIPVQTGKRLRLRLINATAARGLSLKLDGHIPWVMAIDGQPAEPFVARDGRVGLGPGGRVDLFIDTLREPGTVAPILTGLRDEHPIARLVYESGGRARPPSLSAPLPLPPNPLPARIDLKNSLKVELELGSAKRLDPAGPPLFTVPRGRAVTLAVRNLTGHPEVVHLHGHSFRLLDRLDDGWKPYWLDTMVIGEQIERIAFVADNPGKWLIECRMLEHAPPGTDIATWFAVS
jgi:FtsP/CotA-like multicopper oxidase with cupredoxin domain